LLTDGRHPMPIIGDLPVHVQGVFFFPLSPAGL
jgi:hypothetical protein